MKREEEKVAKKTEPASMLPKKVVPRICVGVSVSMKASVGVWLWVRGPQWAHRRVAWACAWARGASGSLKRIGKI